MDRLVSVKIKHISFFSIIMVVVLHAYCHEDINASELSINFIVQNFISKGIVRIAVPTFFFVSGLLFFQNFSGTLQDTIRKFKRRVNSLVLPYFFWCTCWFCFIFILQVLPISKDYFSQPLYKMSIVDNIWNAFCQPIYYPFWYIRELAVYILLTPLLYLILKRVPLLFLIFILGISLVQFSFIEIWNVPFLKFFPFSFFVAGAIAGLRRFPLIGTRRLFSLLPLILAWLALIVIRISGELDNLSGVISNAISQIEVILGVYVFWFGYDLLPLFIKELKSNIYSYTFVIYAFHGIPIVIFKRVYFRIFDNNPYMELLFYFVVPLIVILLSVFVGKILFKRVPLFYAKITGGR